MIEKDKNVIESSKISVDTNFIDVDTFVKELKLKQQKWMSKHSNEIVIDKIDDII
jgi:hypothetical protein